MVPLLLVVAPGPGLTSEIGSLVGMSRGCIPMEKITKSIMSNVVSGCFAGGYSWSLVAVPFTIWCSLGKGGDEVNVISRWTGYKIPLSREGEGGTVGGC